MSRSLTETPTMILLPDLASHCTFQLHLDQNHARLCAESDQWILDNDPNLPPSARRALHGLQAGKLAAMCYVGAAYPELRTCSDFLNWLFHLDDLSDDMDERGIDQVANVVMNSLYHPDTYACRARLNRMTRDLYKRVLSSASVGTQRRFLDTMALFFQAIHQQAIDRNSGVIPDLESYVSLRRDTSGCKSSWVMIEYAHGLDFPDDVMEHPVVQSLGEAANDLVTWSNDVFSYNRERSKGHTHNMIDVLMHQNPSLGLQSAIDLVGKYCLSAIDRFVRERARLPTWGPKIDGQVTKYVDGLADWIVGSLEWSFETKRYFGEEGEEVRRTRRVRLRPTGKRAEETEAKVWARAR